MKTVFVCGACGRVRDTREQFEDVSCYLNAVECEKDSIKLNEQGLAISATAIPEEDKNVVPGLRRSTK